MTALFLNKWQLKETSEVKRTLAGIIHACHFLNEKSMLWALNIRCLTNLNKSVFQNVPISWPQVAWIKKNLTNMLEYKEVLDSDGRKWVTSVN